MFMRMLMLALMHVLMPIELGISIENWHIPIDVLMPMPIVDVGIPIENWHTPIEN